MYWKERGSATVLGRFLECDEMPWDTISEAREKSLMDCKDLEGVAPRGHVRKIAGWNDV
jgi:hypothetical protein